MASHSIPAQRDALANRIKLLINNDLKEICKAHGMAVSGTKAVLQCRVIQILDRLVKQGDQQGLDALRHRIGNHGLAPPVHAHARAHAPAHSSSQYPPVPANNRQTSSIARSVRHFRGSPFYEILETIIPLQDLSEMPQNRNTVRTQIVLADEMARRLKSDSRLRILLFCGQAASMNGIASADVAFPNQIEVKINGDEVKHNFKGLKNKPGTTKPADITRMVRAAPGYPTQISLTYALTTRRFAFIVYLANYISPDLLIANIKSGNVIAKQTVLNELNKANDDPEIAATSVRMSLKDPVSTMRIDLPVRSTVCKHIQCFDGAMFLQLQEQAPQWLCPICNKQIAFQYLCVDKYFEDILAKTSKSIEKVDVEPNGTWTIIKEEDDVKPNGTSIKPRASYDDDFDDDDLVEITDMPTKTADGGKMSSVPANMMTPGSMYTPAASSREPSIAQSTASTQPPGSKRGAGAVIDLTLSDEDDEPRRPPKRAATNSSSPWTNPFPGSFQESSGPMGSNHPSPLPGRTDNFRQTAGQTRHPSFSSSSTTQPSPYGTLMSVTNTTFPSSLTRAIPPPRPASAAHPPPFSLRPPLINNNPTQSHPQQQPQGSMNYGLKLPPMQPLPQPQPPPQQNGWGGDRPYSNGSS